MRLQKLFCFLFISIFFLFCKTFPAQALTIGPPVIEANLEAGESVVQKIKLFNETDATLTVYPVLENFLPEPSTGAPQFLGDSDPAGPARWIKVPVKEIILKSGEIKELILTIKASEIAEPGGYYAALSWQEKTKNKIGIGSVNRVSHLFLFQIKGAVKEEIKIISFTHQEKDSVEQFDLRLENSGTVHTHPTGQLRISNWLGRQVFATPINALQQNILPQSQRQFLLFGPTNLGWGKYIAETSLNYGTENKKIVFWILPPAYGIKLLGILLIILLAKIIYQKAKKKFSL